MRDKSQNQKLNLHNLQNKHNIRQPGLALRKDDNMAIQESQEQKRKNWVREWWLQATEAGQQPDRETIIALEKAAKSIYPDKNGS